MKFSRERVGAHVKSNFLALFSSTSEVIAHSGCWMFLLQYFCEVWIPVITTRLRQTLEAYPGLTPALSSTPTSHQILENTLQQFAEWLLITENTVVYKYRVVQKSGTPVLILR